MTAFDDAVAQTINREGSYSANPNDRGGATMYGITEEVARAAGYQGSMQSMPLSLAKTIYQRHYWEPLGLEAITTLSAAVAAELFDTGVNTGTSVAATFLQRVLNALNDRQAYYPDVIVDGVIGTETIHALAAFLRKRGSQGERVLLKALSSLQGAYYITLAERRPQDEAFTFGWLANRV